MPRLALTPNQERDEAFRKAVKRNMADCGVDYMKDVAAMVGIDRITFSSKMKNPEKFTVKELRRLLDGLKFPPEDRAILLRR